jgi:hypothetical protein
MKRLSNPLKKVYVWLRMIGSTKERIPSATSPEKNSYSKFTTDYGAMQGF